MGRPRKPTIARAREGGTAKSGTVSHRPLPSTEIAIVAGRDVPIEPPAELPGPAQELWREIVRSLAEAGIVDRIDLPALRWLCLEHARGWQAKMLLDEPIDQDDAEALDREIRDMEALGDALKAQIANGMRAGEDIKPELVNASRAYSGQLVNLRTLRSARRVVGNLVALGSTGQLVEHPLLSTERASAANFLRFAGQFGITPSARASLGVLVLEGHTMKRDLEDAIGKPARRPA